MKFVKFFFLILLFVSTCFLVFCNSSYYIEKQFWKYNGGYYLGDIIENKPKNYYICFGNYLIVKNPEKMELGYYKNKS